MSRDSGREQQFLLDKDYRHVLLEIGKCVHEEEELPGWALEACSRFFLMSLFRLVEPVSIRR